APCPAESPLPFICDDCTTVPHETALELEIERELDLTGHGRLDRAAECRARREQRPVHGVDLGHVRAIQKVEGFDNHVELAVRLDVEVLEKSQIERRSRRQSRRVPRQSERTRREWKRAGPAVVA